jgi:alpha-ketoglutarate-dependent taurine dioxygenase
LGRARGAIVLYGFKPDLRAFERFTNQLCQQWQGYRGGVHQKKVLNPDGDGTILSANFYFGQQEQAAFDLALHADMAYQKNFPQVLFLYCVTPSADGGQTTVCDGARFLQELEPATRRFFESKRIKYIRTIRPQGRLIRFWTEDENEARAFCAENDLTLRVERETGNWITEYVVPAIRQSRWGVTVFSNNILTVLDQEESGNTSSLVRMEDDTRIPAEIVVELREIAGRISHDICWQEPGDFAILDNTRALHGRRMFRDLNREIAQRLAASVDW